MRYTLLWVPERSSRVRRLSLSRRAVRAGALSLAMLVGLLILGAWRYADVAKGARRSTALREENIELRAELRGLHDEVRRIDASLQRVDSLTQRVRRITQLRDPARHLTLDANPAGRPGDPPQVLYAKGERSDYEDETMDSKLARRLLDADLERVGDGARAVENEARQLHDSLADDDLRLSHTPSLRPTESRLLVSGFGERLDPYTERPVMHKGVDYAAEDGSDVMAPADGQVVFAGNRGSGYGNVLVLDHGLGFQTHFAHLASFAVQPGQAVQRGGRVATVGTSGRTTSAHLHYEVRYLGVPVDPASFILD